MKTRNLALLTAVSLVGTALILPAPVKSEEPQTIEDAKKELEGVKQQMSELKAQMERRQAEEAAKRQQEKEQQKLAEELEAAKRQRQQVAEEGIPLAEMPSIIDASDAQSHVDWSIDQYRSKTVYPERQCVARADDLWTQSMTGIERSEWRDNHPFRGECTRYETPNPYEKHRKLVADPKPMEVRATFDPQLNKLAGYRLRYRVEWKRLILPNKKYWVDLYYSPEGKFLKSNKDDRLGDWQNN